MKEDDETVKKNGRSQKFKSISVYMPSDVFKHAFERAKKSGRLEPHPEDEQAVEESALSMAGDARREKYDPAEHLHDEMLDEEYKKNLKDRADVEQATRFAEADYAMREEETAMAYAGLPPSKPSTLLIMAAVVGTMITVAPTLHDMVFVMDDDFLCWTLSLGCGLFLGFLIALMILGDSDSVGHRTITNLTGLGAGILVSIALGAIRLGAAKTVGDVILAIGMTVLELGIVVALEGVAARRRSAMSEWQVRNAAAEKASKALDAAGKKLERWNGKLKLLNQAIYDHIDYVDERGLRNLHIDKLEATLLKAARDGYLAGIADNRGRVLGAGRKDRNE